MGRRAPLTTIRQLSEINLTPLMDLTFILLITFIITFPLIEQGITVNLPREDASPLPSDRSRSVISLDSDGNLYLDDQPLGLEALEQQLTILSQTDPETTVYVRADQGVAYGEVVRILRILHERKLTRIALVTRGES